MERKTLSTLSAGKEKLKQTRSIPEALKSKNSIKTIIFAVGVAVGSLISGESVSSTGDIDFHLHQHFKKTDESHLGHIAYGKKHPDFHELITNHSGDPTHVYSDVYESFKIKLNESFADYSPDDKEVRKSTLGLDPLDLKLDSNNSLDGIMSKKHYFAGDHVEDFDTNSQTELFAHYEMIFQYFHRSPFQKEVVDNMISSLRKLSSENGGISFHFSDSFMQQLGRHGGESKLDSFIRNSILKISPEKLAKIDGIVFNSIGKSEKENSFDENYSDLIINRLDSADDLEKVIGEYGPSHNELTKSFEGKLSETEIDKLLMLLKRGQANNLRVNGIDQLNGKQLLGLIGLLELVFHNNDFNYAFFNKIIDLNYPVFIHGDDRDVNASELFQAIKNSGSISRISKRSLELLNTQDQNLTRNDSPDKPVIGGLSEEDQKVFEFVKGELYGRIGKDDKIVLINWFEWNASDEGYVKFIDQGKRSIVLVNIDIAREKARERGL